MSDQAETAVIEDAGALPAPGETNETAPSAEQTVESAETPTAPEDIRAAVEADFQKEFSEDKPADADKPEDPEAEKPEEPKPDETAPDEPGENTDEPDPDERANWSKKTERRFKKLSGDVRELREANATLESQVAAFKEVADLGPPDEVVRLAQSHAQVERYMTENDLTPDQVAEGFQVMAYLRSGDAAGFLEAIKPRYEWALQATGQAMSPDVLKRVEAGELTEEAGLEATRRQQEIAAMQAENERLRHAQHQHQQTQAQAQRQAALVNAGRDEMAKIGQQDGDFALKQEKIVEAINAHVSVYGDPANEQAARQLIRDCHERVTLQMAPTPAPKATPTQPTARASGSPSVTAPPATLYEEINREFQAKYG